MQSIDDKILIHLSKYGRGFIFSSADFTHIGEPKAVLKALERMTNDELILMW